MKKYHLSAFVLASWVHTGETKFEDKKWSKKEAKQGRKFGSPFPKISSDYHAISSPFQMFIMSVKDPRSKPK